MDIRTIFAENLKNLRVRLDISQEKMAEICDLSEKMIREMERANRFPSPASINKILNGLAEKGIKIKPYELFLTDDDVEKFNKNKLLDNLRKKLHTDLDKRIDEYLK